VFYSFLWSENYPHIVLKMALAAGVPLDVSIVMMGYRPGWFHICILLPVHQQIANTT